jgi:hypothetical protein
VLGHLLEPGANSRGLESGRWELDDPPASLLELFEEAGKKRVGYDRDPA